MGKIVNGVANDYEFEMPDVGTHFEINSYKEIRNYIHNYLGLTKDEVKDIVREGIKEEISKYIEQELKDEEKWSNFIQEQLRDKILKSIDDKRFSYLNCTVDKIYNTIDKEIHDQVIKSLDIKLKPVDERLSSTTPITMEELQDIISTTHNLTKKDKSLAEILEIFRLQNFHINIPEEDKNERRSN